MPLYAWILIVIGSWLFLGYVGRLFIKIAARLRDDDKLYDTCRGMELTVYGALMFIIGILFLAWEIAAKILGPIPEKLLDAINGLEDKFIKKL